MAAIERASAPLVDIDEESLALILELQRQDGENLESKTKGKQREGSPQSDLEIALMLYLEEVAQAAIYALDLRMARSLQTAIQEDGDTLQHLATEEDMAANDHRLSLEISLEETQKTTAPAASFDMGNSAGKAGENIFEKLSSFNATGGNDGMHNIYDISDDEVSLTGQRAESSRWAATRLPVHAPAQPFRVHECIACGEMRQSKDLSRAPCKHQYCRDCLRRLFEDSMLDETLFPPRCCKKNLPLDENIKFLPPKVVKTFRKKAIEFSTPNRTYCHRKGCSAFISPKRCVDGVARCGACKAETCTNCKSASHGGDCPHDEQLQQVIAMAQNQGWQRCRNCRTMVELDYGCNHMTCRCGAQFCYTCGAPWKQCDCAQWDENRLEQRAIQIDARPARRRQRQPVPAPMLVNEEDDRYIYGALRTPQIKALVQDLRIQHECTHPLWEVVDGPQVCEECGDRMPLYIFAVFVVSG
ncbi:hypothetical protein PG984_009027 [Apiospora sp. TS-2023a]